MKSKIYTIVAIGIVIVTVISVCLIIILTGAKNGGFNYVKLEYGGQIEFVTDNKFKVVSYKPLDENAKLAIINTEILNNKVDNVINDVLTELLKMGKFELDINKHNVCKIIAVSGLTQALDVHVYKAVNKFVVENQVPTVIIENANDMQMLKEAKQLKVSVNELALINSIVNSNNISKKSISNKMPADLIDIIMNIEKEYLKLNSVSKYDIELKEQMVDEYKDVLSKHKSNITKQTTRSFVTNQVELNKRLQTKYELNYVGLND